MNSTTDYNHIEEYLSTVNSRQTSNISQNLLAYIVSGSFLMFLTFFLLLFLLLALHCGKTSRRKRSIVYEHRITARDNIYSVDPTVQASPPYGNNITQDDAHHSSSTSFAPLTTEVSNIIDTSNLSNAFNCHEDIYMEIPHDYHSAV